MDRGIFFFFASVAVIIATFSHPSKLSIHPPFSFAHSMLHWHAVMQSTSKGNSSGVGRGEGGVWAGWDKGIYEDEPRCCGGITVKTRTFPECATYYYTFDQSYNPGSVKFLFEHISAPFFCDDGVLYRRTSYEKFKGPARQPQLRTNPRQVPHSSGKQRKSLDEMLQGV